MSSRRQQRAKNLLETMQDMTAHPAQAMSGAQSKPFEIDINKITPDPLQPRKSIPYRVQTRWNEKIEGDTDIFECWANLIEIETGRQFDIFLHLDNEDELDRVEKPHPLEASLIELTDLAGSILNNGLANPITVFGTAGQYRIETGERRWMAYGLLGKYFPDDWTKIPCYVVETQSVWRQAAENGARQNLNAIGLARQLSILIMDLHGLDNFKPFEDFVNDGICDRGYYAQVADGNEWRVPRGKGELILQATGLKHSDQIRKYRALLRLPDEIWIEADDFNLTENELRPYTVTTVTVSNEKDAEVSTVKPVSVKKAQSVIEELRERYLPRWKSFDEDDRISVIQGLSNLLEELQQSLGDEV